MKRKKTMEAKTILAAALACAPIATTVYAQTIDTRIGKLDFELGVPTQQTAAKLYDEMDFQRAVQSYLWGLPIVGVEMNRQGLVHDTGARSGDLAIYDDYRSKGTILAANNNTPYIYGFMDLSEKGPMVLDFPPGPSAGAVIDWWERPLTDVGLPSREQGKGGKYLFVGPGQETPQNTDGYLVFKSPTFKTELFFRTLHTDPAQAKAFVDAAQIFPWSEREKPPRTRLLKPMADGTLLSQTIPSGMAYWERLSQALAGEPGEDRDRFFMAMLEPLGLENGKPFAPDTRQKKILEEAATVGEAMARAHDFRGRLPGIRYRADATWEYVIPPWHDVKQDVENSSQLDERIALWFSAWGMSNGSVTKTPGVGQIYLGSFVDKEGQPFDGAKSYRLRVPTNPPAKLFWSVTAYEVNDRTLIKNAAQKPDRVSTQEGLEKNADGSVDIHFGPTSPKGHEKNWIQTAPNRAWFTFLRLYGPLEPYYDRSWVLPDIEKVK